MTPAHRPRNVQRKPLLRHCPHSRLSARLLILAALGGTTWSAQAADAAPSQEAAATSAATSVAGSPEPAPGGDAGPARAFPFPLHPHGMSPAGDTATTAPVPGVRKPLWELGLGIATLHWPDDRGADHGRNYVLPLPYVVYRGQFLRADRDGARAVLVEGQRVEMDVSINGSAPVRSDTNGVRAGMADLPSSFEIGPNLNVMLWRAADRSARLDFRLPVRAALTLQTPIRSIGMTSTPKLNLDLARVAGGWNVGLLAGPVFGSRRYHEHYYGVSTADATATRPAYSAHSGYAGWHAIASASQRFDSTWLAAYVRHDQLGGAVFSDSPLLRKTHTWSFGVGMAWVLAASSQTVLVKE
jgi:outer membrane protein